MNKIMSHKCGETSKGDSLTVIQPTSGWQIIDFKELKEFRDLFYFLVWRDIKSIYAQTILGFLWAILNPLIQIVIFTIIFGKVAKIPTDGVPYVLFSSIAIIPWAYISQAISQSSQSLIQGSNILGKIYFPRLMFPITPVLSKLVDFGISMVIILGIMLYYRVSPTWNLLLFPVVFLLMISIPLGIGTWLSSLAIRFRDVKQVMPFIIQMLMYTAPIVYSASSISEGYRLIYSLNPIVGVIEGFRACFLGTPIPWVYILPGILTAAILVISGMLYFKRMERIFVDVI
ncbi:ABC transporter permease [Candidatus Nitrospira allomarina]|uniref:Transport permease protein n=1 Tax=Candidatus Nitrospira allomarina TaxID=3020900 RepID=A0AA96JZ11_9BACT|nr:ABC transporter permease [Candidatus Nitrospira allomarina]WNM58139.1 ABC transporter permease [Candidatus Nitrospira allomarina]